MYHQNRPDHRRRRHGLAVSFAALAAAAPIAAPSHARAQDVPAPPFAEGFSDTLDWLALAGTQLGLVALRLFADVEYEAVELLPGTRSVLVTGVTAAIPVPYAPPRACTVTIGAYEGRQSGLAALTGLLGRQGVRLEDVVVPLECLPPPARTTVQVAGLTEIVVDELRLSTDYDLPTARGEVALSLSARDIADVELRGEVDYAFVRFDFSDAGGDDPFTPEEEDEPEPKPVVEFGPIDLTITDRGLADRAVPFLRLVGLTPEQLPAIAGDGVRGALGPIPLADDLERELERFLTEGGRLAVALRPGTLWLDELDGLSPPEIVAAFNPSVGAGTRPTLVAPALLAALSDGDPTDEQRLEGARAFLEGEGLPRNPARAVSVLEPILGTDAAAQALAAEAILADDGPADRAYGLALRAGAAGEDIGSVLRRAEARLDAARVAEVQASAFGNWEGREAFESAIDRAVEDGDTLAILDAARTLEAGEGASRDYGRALKYALLADAAGEIGARPIVDRLEARLTADAEAREAWAPTVSDAREAATQRWLPGGLAVRLAERAEADASDAAGTATDEDATEEDMTEEDATVEDAIADEPPAALEPRTPEELDGGGESTDAPR